MMLRAFLTSTAVLGLLAAAPATAQQAEGQAAGSGSLFGDIIVTANRRAENIQDVPVAVSALNEALIEQRFSRDLLDLGSIAPNLIVDPVLGNGTAAISIRGFQLSDVEKSFDPPVGVFLDGVYLASNTGALLTVFDASVIEVLRGPQGTLFGRNTIGGLLHVQRNKPTGELGGKASLTYGRFDQLDVKGVINFPTIADGLINAKVAAISINGGGYFYNVTRNEREGDNDLLMISPMVQINPAPNAEINISYDYIRDRTDTRPVTSLTTAAELFGGPATGGAGLGRPASDSNFHRRPTTSLEQTASLTTHAVTVNGEVEVAPGHALVAVLSYRDTKENAIQEFDGVAATLFNTERPQQIDQMSAELRYQGEIGPAKIVTGLYYFDSDYNINQRTFFFGGETGGTDYQQSSKSYAAFAQVDWEVIDRLTLTVGGRYLKDKKDACGGLGSGPVGNRTLLVSYGTCSAERTSDPSFSNETFDGDGVLINTADGSASWSKFTPKIGISYALDQGLVYASYSEGFRSGGFNGRGSDALTLGPYDPETVSNFEVGLKSEWLDNRVIFNLTAFYTDYKDKQEDVVFPDPRGATVTIVQNAASATIKGVEAELRAQPAEGLSFGLSVGHLDAKFDSWSDLAADGVSVIDKSDFELRRAPKWSVQADASYEYFIDDTRSVLVQADFSYKSDYYIIANTVTAASPNPGFIDGFGLLNASASYKTEHYKVSIFGRNLTGADYFQHVLDVGTTYAAGAGGAPVPNAGLWTFGTINAPTTYGVEFAINF